MPGLYPLKFEPILKEKIWGGRQLAEQLGKNGEADKKYGESWEISAVPGNISIVSEGPLKGRSLTELTESFGEQLLGSTVIKRTGNEFPLLIKFLDAADDLSVQVHPGDALAKKRHKSPGKTEMWYILSAEPGSVLITGFKNGITENDYFKYLEEEELEEILKQEEVVEGESYFIPAGTVHAIGGGIMLAEIQQSSDVTYRIYDYNRTDDEGKKRELHTEEALAAINFESRVQNTTDPNPAAQIAKSLYFEVNKVSGRGERILDYSSIESFVVLMGIKGKAEVVTAHGETASVHKGETVLIPAELKEVKIKCEGPFELLETYVPLR